MLSKFKWAIVGASIALGFGIYYLSDDNFSRTSSRTKLTKEKVLKIAQDLKKELLPIFITLASFSISVKEKIAGRIPEDKIKDILMANSPIPSLLQKAENKVYQKHRVTQAEFQKVCENEFKNNKEVQDLLNEMRTTMDRAFKGIHPSSNASLPEFLTSDYILKVTEELYDITKYTTYKTLQKYQGVNPNSPEFRKISEELDQDTIKAKNKIFDQFGMNGLEEPPTILMHVGIQKYKSDPEFINKLAAIEQNFQATMNRISEASLPSNEIKRLENKFEQNFLIQELEEPREVIEEEYFEPVHS